MFTHLKPVETAQEAVHQVMTKKAARTLSIPATHTRKPSTPEGAAKGDDDLMSQPVKRS